MPVSPAAPARHRRGPDQVIRAAPAFRRAVSPLPDVVWRELAPGQPARRSRTEPSPSAAFSAR
jgi:hypothetical protein